jgi:hypothetical protein
VRKYQEQDLMLDDGIACLKDDDKTDNYNIIIKYYNDKQQQPNSRNSKNFSKNNDSFNNDNYDDEDEDEELDKATNDYEEDSDEDEDYADDDDI